MATTDLRFDGSHVYWFGVGNYKATSGLPGHQVASEQTVSDAGPIPEGYYWFSLADAGTARVTDVAKSKLDTNQGIESLVDMPGPDGKVYNSSAWGNNRVRLNITQILNAKAKHRGGFYLHDSVKGYSHGCIEVQPTFFAKLRQFAAGQGKKGKHRLTLFVQYASSATSTYGDTDH